MATLEVGGTGIDGRSMVTKNDFRFLHTLENMGPSPEPNLTVLYSSRLPESFKKYATKISVDTSSIQYENDDVMKVTWGDDYSICCCVSATQTGKEMQFFGARANLAKCLLYAINGGVDVKNREQVGPAYKPVTSEYLDYDEVVDKFDAMMDWLADLYVNTLNLIQYMHDKYYYEAAEMARWETPVQKVLNQLMKESDNLNAEAMLCRIASQATGKKRVTAEDGIVEIMKLVRNLGHDPKDYKIADGCGLSNYNYLSPALLVDFLKYAYSQSDVFQKLYKSLPVAGIDGTLKNRMKNTPAFRNVHAKTGSFTAINALAGYLKMKNGHTLAFAIMNQNVLSAAKARAFQDKVCEVIIGH